MAYQSLYRKYRPQTFSDVMGQGHVIRTLQNALTSGRVAHGYLFTGTRGTAKTTIARLLAKALNCESSPRPVAEPCNQCAACQSITAGSSIDVIEMDAASHRGVADIEEVRKSVGYGPMELRYKVFIIDEAHQLSSDAKDAFLKTLEEPPDNVVFILATTEPQAIPITIRSRCQQFDFKRGSLTEITARLRHVLECEGVAYTQEAVNLIARGAEGSYRDSLSLLEQVLAFAPKQITAADVDTVLGTLDTEMLGQVTETIANRDAAKAFALAGALLDAGKEARTLLRTMAAHFRDLLLTSVGGPAVATELTPEEVQRLQLMARAFTPQQLMAAISLLNEAQGETRWNNQHRLLVELTFLKLMTIGDAPNAPLPVAPIVFSAAPSESVSVHEPVKASTAEVLIVPMTRPATVPPATDNGNRIPSPPQSLPSSPVAVPPTPAPPPLEEELPPSYFADDAVSDEDDELLVGGTDEDMAETEAMSPALPTAAMPAPTDFPPEATRLDDETEVDPNYVPQTGPGLFDDTQPEFAAPDTLATDVAPISEPLPTTPEPTDTPAPEPVATPANGFDTLFGEEVAVSAPVPLAKKKPTRKK